MATLAPTTPPTSPPFHRRRKSWARKVERCCWSVLSFFPLTFVYGLTSWAVWVEVQVSFFGGASVWAYVKAALGITLYALLNVSYTTAVFTSPGSPLDERIDLSKRGKGAGYEGLPQYEDGGDGADGAGMPHGMTMVTAKSSDGRARYCKKCACLKPDRTHHCSTCGRCVLKMDHHCPWLATCVGLRNYKPFLLFLIYTSLFCWLDLAVSGTWVWAAVMDDRQMHEGMRVVNTILLAVLGGIIGLVLTGFTSWHIYLAVTGQTTIESLEKTRYLSPIRKNLERQFQHQPQRTYIGEDEEAGEQADGEQEQTLLEHLKETHANALPGVLRPEEGESTRTPSPLAAAPSAPNSSFQPGHSPAKDSLHRSYASLEAQREHERYSAFLDEQDSEKLPNAFNLGWKRNLLHVFGERPLFWALPLCNTSGDGWMWEISRAWTEARGDVERERRARAGEEAVWEREGDEWGRRMAPPAPNYRWQPGQGFVNQAPQVPPTEGFGGSPTRRANGHPHAGSQVQMQPLDRRKAPGGDEGDDYDTSSDEEHHAQHPPRQWPARVQSSMANWNDVPDDFLSSGRSRNRSRSRGRPKDD